MIDVLLFCFTNLYVFSLPISSLTSPESETSSNSIVLVGYGTHAQLARLEEMKISEFPAYFLVRVSRALDTRSPIIVHLLSCFELLPAITNTFAPKFLLPPAELPHNVLVIDMATFERSLYAAGARGIIPESKTERPRTPSCTLNLEGLLRSLQQPQSSCTSVSTNNSSSNGNALSSSTTPRLSPSVAIPQCSLVNSGNEAFMMLFAFQMLLDPLRTRIPTVRKGALGSQMQGQALAMTNMNTIQTVNMRGPLGMGMSGMLTQGISSVPMYGISTVPMVIVDGVSGFIAASASPQSTQILNNNKSNSQEVKANSGSRKVQRVASVLGLAGESSHLQESMKRIYSSGPTKSSNSTPLLLVPVEQQQKESEQGATGSGIRSLWDQKPSLVGLGERHHTNSSLLR